ncbi:predicted membrane protein [Corynebacterium kutscheri]|uniref:Putative membrane protein n=1 Tax=Corynebacterium kutscheri TaxID=35755 RepID=A0A0F6R0U0_9CORY|nr:PH domain-containing protein [Corynebacterium kutscheri]AKE40648.1 putative membrane protein [Corynebacterium kutscheri]VEH11045.1 predicted membrane protein [Corynebacterium kutscheri]VEH80476.1 predicted membrane protein [Corynebacterium kutscheri]
MIIFALTAFSEKTLTLLGQFGDFAAGAYPESTWATVRIIVFALGVSVVAVALVFAFSLIWWRANTFEITNLSVTSTRGVLHKTQQIAPRDKIQAVNVVQPIHARLFGLAAVRIEIAGGGLGSAVAIEYVTTAQAHAIRHQLLGDDETSEEIIAPIKVWRSFLATLLSISALFSIALGVTTLFVGVTVATASLIPTAINMWRILDGSYRFTARKIADQIVVTYGLATLHRNSVTIAKVHAVEMSQPALWRIPGWWSVRVTVVGYGQGEKGVTLLPVGSKGQALKLVQLLLGQFEQLQVYRTPRKGRWVSPIDADKQFAALGQFHMVTAKGKIGRKYAIAFRRHIQQLSVTTPPLHRMIGMQSVRVGLARGPVTMTARDIALGDAQDLFMRLRSPIDAMPHKLPHSRHSPNSWSDVL